MQEFILAHPFLTFFMFIWTLWAAEALFEKALSTLASMQFWSRK